MNGVLNSFGLAGGVAIALLSSVFAYINKDRYKTLINDIYLPGNQELREQLGTAREEIKELTADNAQAKAQVVEKDKFIKELKDINSKLPDYTALAGAQNKVLETMSNNHTEVMSKMTEVIKMVGTKVK